MKVQDGSVVIISKFCVNSFTFHSFYESSNEVGVICTICNSKSCISVGTVVGCNNDFGEIAVFMNCNIQNNIIVCKTNKIHEVICL